MSGGDDAGPPSGGQAGGAGPRFWLSALAGWAIIAWAVAGIVRHRVDTRPGELVRFIVAGLVLHDAVLVPLTILGAVLIRRAVPAPARRWCLGGAMATGVVLLVAYPLVRRFADRLGNPTSLPHDYGRAVLLVVALLWVALGAAALAGHARRPARGSPRAGR